jgi:hypothetical protein
MNANKMNDNLLNKVIAVRNFLVTIFFVLVVINLNLRSQEADKNYKWKAPLITINGDFSYVIPLQDLHGSGVSDFFQFKNYGTRTGIAFNIDAKVALNKKRNLRAFLSLGFVQANRDDSLTYIDSNSLSRGYPLPGTSFYGAFSGGQSRVLIRDLYIGLGVEHTLAPDKTVIPFFGVELSLDYIYGYYVQDPGLKGKDKNFNIKGGFRGGFGINTGADIRMLNNVGVILGAKYKFANVIGKNSVKTTENDAMGILDAAASNLNSLLNKNRNIGYFQFYLGLSVFLGLK